MDNEETFFKIIWFKNKDDIIGYTEEERNNNVESIHIERIVPIVINLDKYLSQIRLKISRVY